MIPRGPSSLVAPRMSFLTADADVPAVVELLTAVQEVLKRSEYNRTDVLPQPGGLLDLVNDPINLLSIARHRPNLMQPSAIAGLYQVPLRPRHSRAVDLHRLFAANAVLAPPLVKDLLGRELFHKLLAARALSEAPAGIRSEILLTTYRGHTYASDALHHRRNPEFCYVGRLSLAAPDFRLNAENGPHRVSRLLDLGCGSGIGALALSDLADEVVGTDILDRCVRYAKVNAALNGAANAMFRTSNLFDNVDGSFDLILTHPPGGWSEGSDEQPVVAANGGEDYGLELPSQMIGGALGRLRPDGWLYAILMAPVINGRPYASQALERICNERAAEVTLYPLLEYFEYRHRALYRRHGVRKLVRYLAVLRPADMFTVRFGRLDTARLLSARARSLPARVLAGLTETRRRSPAMV